jgi:hypothetical protein
MSNFKPRRPFHESSTWILEDYLTCPLSPLPNFQAGALLTSPIAQEHFLSFVFIFCVIVEVLVS